MAKKVLGVEFAPVNVPLERRLQTFSALGAFLIFQFGGVVGTIFTLYLLFKTSYWWLSLLYFVWYIYDWDSSSRGGHRVEWIRRLKTKKYIADFFPIRLTKTADLDPNENYILGYHPHGFMSIGAFINFASEATGFSETFPGIRPYLLTLKLLHKFPIYREILSTYGVCDVSRESIEYILKTKGNAVCIIIGGAKESMDAVPNQDEVDIVLKDRKGFCKMALRTGAHLVPVFSFGENEIYNQIFSNEPGSRVRKFQRAWQKIFGFAPILIYGRGVFNYSFGLVPFRKAINTVVGKPILVTKTSNPTQEEIDKLHETYMKELHKLFETHKERFGYGHQKMVFCE